MFKVNVIISEVKEQPKFFIVKKLTFAPSQVMERTVTPASYNFLIASISNLL